MSAINVFFPDDIANVLRAVNHAGGTPPDLVELIRDCDDPEHLAAMVQAYRHGHRDGLEQVGKAFGIVVLK